jgi:hypothetical protein
MSPEDDERHDALYRFAEKRLSLGEARLSQDQIALYYDLIATVAYIRKLEDEVLASRRQP